MKEGNGSKVMNTPQEIQANYLSIKYTKACDYYGIFTFKPNIFKNTDVYAYKRRGHTLNM